MDSLKYFPDRSKAAAALVLDEGSFEPLRRTGRIVTYAPLEMGDMIP
jgi:hypothetical protein